MKIPDYELHRDIIEFTRANNITESFDAFLGKSDGSTITDPDTEPTNSLVWYHLGDGSPDGKATLRAGGGIPYIESANMINLPIRVGRLPTKENIPGYVVMGLAGKTGQFTAGSSDVTNNIIINNLYPTTTQIRILRVEPTLPLGLSVQVVGPWFYPNRNSLTPQIYTTLGLFAPITSAVGALSAGQHQIGIVAVDLSVDAVTTNPLVLLLGTAATSGSALPNRSAFTATDVGTIDTRGYASCGVIYLYYGQTTVTESDVLRDLEVRSMFYPPHTPIVPDPTGVYTNMNATVRGDGTVTNPSSGPTPTGSGTVLLQYSASADRTFSEASNGYPNLQFDTADADPGGNGAYVGGTVNHFQFTAPLTANYTIHTKMNISGVFTPIDAFAITGGAIYPGHLLYTEINWGATGGPFVVENTVTIPLNAGDVLAPTATVNDLGYTTRSSDSVIGSSAGGDPFADRCYIEITWNTSPIPAPHVTTVTADYTILPSDDMLGISPASGDVTLSLPAAPITGKRITIRGDVSSHQISVLPIAFTGYIEGGSVGTRVYMLNTANLADLFTAVLVHLGSDVWAFESGFVDSTSGTSYWSATPTVANRGTSADLSGTGGTGQYLKQVATGAAVTVGVIPFADLPVLPYIAKTGTYTITDSDYTIDCTSGTFTVTLPTAVGRTGRIFVVKNTGAGTITLATTSSQTIFNVTAVTTLTLVTGGTTFTVQSTGANWIAI